MRWELDMMAQAAAVGVSCPTVHSYSCVGEVELCMFEFVEGTPLEKLLPDSAVAARAHATVHEYITKMEQVQRDSPAIGQNTLLLETCSSGREMYLYLLKQAWGLHRRTRFNLPAPAIDLFPVNEPCVLVHGDLRDANNAIVHADGPVTLIDWECAGFLPLHIGRFVLGTLDETQPLGALMGHLCRAQKYGAHGEKEKYSAAVEKLVDGLAAASAA
jgi:aminoglycoside phosphotransferase (APT) family kinase protein